MKEEIKKLIGNALQNLGYEIKEAEVDYPKNENFGDYTTNIAMILSRNAKKNPMEIAEKLKTKIENLKIKDVFEKIEIIKPGYINFYLSKEYLQNKVKEINELENKFGDSQIGKGIKINNEFISANPTGPLHLGNGRGGFWGDVISKILKKNNFEVINEYYVNNAGEQTIKLAHSFKKDEEAVYSGKYIDEMRNKYIELTTQSVQASATPLSAAVMSDYICPSVERMGIKDMHYVYEKDLYDNGFVDRAIEILKEKKLTYEKEEALWFKSTEFGDDKDRVLIKKDGQKTYFASDCGYILNKIERGFDKIIEIWGADHHGYINRFQAAAEALGFKKEKIKFIIVQLVRLVKNGKEVRMSKRAGNVVYIDELLEKVGLDVARFFFLMYSPDTHMNFDLGLAEEQSQKNPVYYVQYAHARICSIIKKSEKKKGRADLSLLTHEKELNLIRELNKFPELIKEITGTYEVHKLPYYVIKLADKFHSFYNNQLVIDKNNPELTKARLNLINAVKIVLAETLRLIGVSAPEKM
jgi:arginyl-tRNA synthetase